MDVMNLTASPTELTASMRYESFAYATAIRLVLETLEPLSDDRKCFRMINGVLVERTVKDVAPALKTNAEGLKKVLDDLVKQYKTKQDELEKWKVRAESHVDLNPQLTRPLLGCGVFELSHHLYRKRIIFKSFSRRSN